MEPRTNTNKLIELAMEGTISWFDISFMCLKWMSEEDVTKMINANYVNFN